MTEEIRKAVIQAIAEKWKLPVYGQFVPQGVKKPCFTVELAEMEQKRLMGKRAARKACFVIRYYCGEEESGERSAVTDGLYEVLLIIGEDEKFAASGMKHEKTEDGVRFLAEYEYHIIFTEDEAELMQRLEYNGEEAVGYEKEGDIQQGTAE